MQAHTEHLYQWYIKRGASHALVTVGYGLMTLACGMLALRLSGMGAAWTVLLSIVLWSFAGIVWMWRRSSLIGTSQGRVDE